MTAKAIYARIYSKQKRLPDQKSGSLVLSNR